MAPVSSVGSKKCRPSACRLPPVTTDAPRSTASAMCRCTFATASAEISGPCCESSANPGPTTSDSIASRKRSTNASWMPDCTSSRLAHTQVCPALRNFEAIAPATAASRSASSKTISGALPPSSRATLFTVRALWLISSLPTAVEPVKLSARTRGSEVSSSPTISGTPTTTLRTPSGRPARLASSASAMADRGVSSAGLTTIGQPAARAGPALRKIIADGKFHGVIAAATPAGWRRVSSLRERWLVGMTSP